ncbi:synaptobrevin-related protein [Nosema bombycis CQ1]|uniref:Synaptobrevin-related protein n=1 Tax=Nosema bombycis (strain CQ1 / CVCC 102059) TaxID=578461 RepID=R0KNB6_NOSB1|nr:synaptobrevin-related protein [Nosema bombycis CQ1]|eukprot:EOB11647.1 synaptobrevin-related protein [Nosema bombycis CQ1]
MGDEVTKKIEQEVKETQDKLKDRLRETEELGDMEKGLQKQTFGLKKTTEEHQEISRGVKWKMFFKYALWIVIGLAIIGLLFMIFIRPLLKGIVGLVG